MLQGTTTYFSSNCDVEDAEVAKEFMMSCDLSAYNTRLFKMSGNTGPIEYEIRLASMETDGKAGVQNDCFLVTP